MPVISTRRYSTSSGSSSYLPPSIGGTTSSLSNLGKSGTSGYNSSSYRSSSLTNSTYSSGYSGSSGTSYLPRTSSFRTGLYGTSSSSTLGGVTSYRHSSYLTGGNNDTTSASRFGVSSNKYTRSSSDRDTKRITGKTQYNNNIINTTTTSPTVSNRTKLLQSKPPISGSLRTSQRLSENQIRDRDHVTSKSDQNCNSNYNSNNNNSNCNELISNNSKFASSTAGQLSSSTTIGQDQLSNNNNTTTTTKKLSSSSLSSSPSLARQVATSGLDFYEKYSPVHYIPKCELSRSRSLSEATTNKYNNDNKLSNSSSNVHQLLHQKEVNKLQDSKDCAATTTTTSATSSSPSSSSKDISTTQLASKVKKLFAATASNTATNNNNFVQNLNASSIVVFNNNNNHHNQYKKNILADANNVIPNNNPLQTVNSTAHRLSDKLDFSTTLSSSETFNKVCANVPSASSFENCNVLNCQNFSIVDTTHFSIIHSTTNDNSVVNKKTIPCTHCCSNSNHQEQMIHTCRNCNKTTATVFAPTSSSPSSSSSLLLSSPPTPPPITLLSQSPTQLLQSQFQTGENKQNSATIISINSSADLGDQCISNQNFEAIKSKFEVNNKPNLKATKQLLLLTSKSDDNKNMSNNSFTRLWAETNNSSSLATASACGPNCPSSVTVTYHTTTTTVTIQSPNTVTTVNANIKPSKTFNKNNLFDFRLELSKHKQTTEGSTAGRNNSPLTTISSSSAHNTEVSTKDGGNNGSHYFGQNLISTYRDQNFLKNECEIARSQVVKLYNATNDIKSSGLVESEEYNNNNINKSSELLNNKYSTSSKNDIKPLVHKTSKNKTTSRLAKIISHSNMNCLQNTNSEFLDDIKYIDSDDSERQPNNQNKSSLSNNSSSLVPNYDKMKFNHTKLVTSSTSTLPLTSKQRDLINSDSSSKTSATNKFNTLNDFKRIPTSVRSTSNYLTSNKLSTSLSPSASNNISNRSSSLLSVKNKTKIASSTPVINNISTSSTSRESTPSNSPQMIRRNNLLNSDNFTHQSQQSKHHYQQQQHHEQHIPDNSQSLSSSSPTSSPSSISNDQKLSNKKCDIDESVRNASIRSALPSSPTPSRYWDREGRTSGLSSRYNDLDDYSSTKSALNSSESNEKVSTEGLCGLRNIGNTCFMNSVIQCLSHTRELTKFLKTQTSVRSSTKDQQILYEFAKLIREMWTPNIRSVTPLELKSAFSSKHRMYSGYNQQDAQEFLRFFLDSLHCALNNGVKGEHLKIDDSLSDNRKADLTWEWYSKIENSVVRDLFVGQLKSTLKCTTCGNTSVTFDPFWDLSLPLPSNSRCKLDSCLDLFIREEVLDGDEMPTCSKCQIRRKCTKTFTIQRFPKYLVIHLKRFSETRWSKMSNIVEFPTGERELNMGPYAANGSSVSYSLYAISNHMGSTAGGHYVALCKHPTTKKWHEFNDNVVSDALSESVLVSSSAYLLFYERA